MYALRAPRRCQRRPRPLYSRARRAPAAPACFRSIARAETSPRSASPSVSVSVPPAATSRSVVRCLGSFAPDLSPSPASCSDPGVCDRMVDARTREPALRCVSGTPRGTRGEQGICARAHAGSGGARSTNLGKSQKAALSLEPERGRASPRPSCLHVLPVPGCCLARTRRSGLGRWIDPPVADALLVRSSGCVVAKTCLG